MQTFNEYLLSKGHPEVENGNFFKYFPIKQKYPVLEVFREAANKDWNKALPLPLIAGSKVVNLGRQPGMEKGYVLIRRGKRVDCFSKKNFIIPAKNKLFRVMQSKQKEIKADLIKK